MHAHAATLDDALVLVSDQDAETPALARARAEFPHGTDRADPRALEPVEARRCERFALAGTVATAKAPAGGKQRRHAIRPCFAHDLAHALEARIGRSGSETLRG